MTIFIANGPRTHNISTSEDYGIFIRLTRLGEVVVLGEPSSDVLWWSFRLQSDVNAPVVNLDSTDANDFEIIDGPQGEGRWLFEGGRFAAGTYDTEVWAIKQSGARTKMAQMPMVFEDPTVTREFPA